MATKPRFQFIRHNKAKLILPGAVLGAALVFALQNGCSSNPVVGAVSRRERLSLDMDWRFTKGDPPGNQVSLLYDVRPAGRGRGRRGAAAAAAPTNEASAPAP
jgi:hypothetical protein